MEDRIQSIEMEILSLKRDVGRVRESTSELNFKQSAAELALIRLTNALAEVREDLASLSKMAFQTSDSLVFLLKKHGELTDQVNRLEEEIGHVKRAVFEHTILLKNLRRDVEQVKADVIELKEGMANVKTDVASLKTNVADLKTDVAGLKTDVADLKTDVAELKADVAELKTDVTQIKTDLADLKTGQAQILEAIRNLQR